LFSHRLRVRRGGTGMKGLGVSSRAYRATLNHTFERTARQRGWRVPSRLRRSAAAQCER
jgi:hypothetical protein